MSTEHQSALESNKRRVAHERAPWERPTVRRLAANEARKNEPSDDGMKVGQGSDHHS